ncbi:MAG: hypothetical protein ACD_15C00142G0003, partial [uncultured bacterium]
MIRLGYPKKSLGLPYIKEDDRFKHAFILGSTGSGKTTFLTNLISKELDAGGIIVLDPSGDLAEKVARLDFDPSRLVYVDRYHPISLNPLKTARTKAEQANELIEIISTIVATFSPGQMEFTVLMQHIMRNAIRVREFENIQEIGHFMEFPEERKKINDRFWFDFDSKINREKADSARRINARLSAFYEDENIWPFVSGSNQFDIPGIARDKKIVIFDLGSFDDHATVFIGCLITHQLKGYYLAAERGTDPLLFYCDEFHQFFTRYFDRFLNEARKYNLSINLATHSLDLMDRRLAQIVLTNCYLKVVLGCNADDAKMMSKNMSITESDLMKLCSHEAYISIGRNPTHIDCFPLPELKESKPEIE